MANSAREDLMLRAAWMYYHDNLTHREIAARLHTSRVKITRLLKAARDCGMVEIKVTKPLPRNHERARQLEQTFGIENAIVVGGQTEGHDEIARATAEHFHYHLANNAIVGFGWSSTVRYIADHIDVDEDLKNCKVVELVGSMIGHDNPYSISGRVAETLGTMLYPLPVPVIVKNESTHDALLQEPSIQHNLELARASDIAIVGTGSISLQSTLIRTGHLDANAVKWLRQQGAVGDVLMRFFDIDGKPVATPWDNRVIGLTWDNIHQLKHVVVAAFGQQKIEPLLGVLRSGLAHCVVTDLPTAENILKSAT